MKRHVWRMIHGSLSNSLLRNSLRFLPPLRQPDLKSDPLPPCRSSRGARRRIRRSDFLTIILQDVSCSSTTSEVTDASSVTDDSVEVNVYEASQITLSPEVHILISQNPRHTKSFKNGFLLLTKEDGFILDDENSLIRPITLKREQQELVGLFTRVPFYRLMFRLCGPAIQKAPFWKTATVLPCRISQSGECEIAWEVIEALVHNPIKDAFKQLAKALQLCKKADTVVEDTSRAIQDILAFNDKDFELLDGSDRIEGVKRFLHSCVWLPKGQHPVFDIEMDLSDKKVTLSGVLSDPIVDNDIGMNRVLLHRGRIGLFNGNFLPITRSWLLSFISMQLVLPRVVGCVDTERLRRVMGVGHTAISTGLAYEMGFNSPTMKKWAIVGHTLLRLATLLNRWQSSYGCRVSNCKEESVESYEEIRNILLLPLILNRPDVSDILSDWTKLDIDKSFLVSSPFDIVWVDVWEHASTDLAFDPDTVQYAFSDPAFVIVPFKAFVGMCYEAYDFHVVWEICLRIGLVKIQPDSHLTSYVDGWKSSVKARRHIRAWERSFAKFEHIIQLSDYQSVCDAIGFTFHQRRRFDWAMVHPSVAEKHRSLHGWSALIGMAIVNVWVQQYLTKSVPSLSQTAINNIFCEKQRKKICLEVAVELGVHRIGLLSPNRVRTYLSKHGDDIEALKGDTGSLNYIALLMHNVIGALVWDTGMDFDKVFKVIQPILEHKLNPKPSRRKITLYIADRLVPDALEITRFTESTLAECEYYPTHVQLVENRTKTPIVAFCVLTKVPLTPIHREHIPILGRKEGGFMQCDPRQETTSIDEDKHGDLVEFQSSAFDSLQPPLKRRIAKDPQTKKYLVAPTIISESDSTDDIDWEFVKSVSQFAKGTLPYDISTVVQHFFHGETAADLKDCAESVVRRDEERWAHDTQDEDEDIVDRAWNRLLFRTQDDCVVCVPKGAQWTGEVMNVECMKGRFAPQSWIIGKQTRSVDPQTSQCLPYTLSYFKCLARIPFMLDLLEKSLLTEDYRQLYGLPSSIDSRILSMALDGFGSPGRIEFMRLEALGTSVFYYLTTLDIVLHGSRSDVGEFSLRRTKQLTSKILQSPEALQCLLGHTRGKYFYPYRNNDSWYPPAGAPFILENPKETDVADDMASIKLVYKNYIKPMPGRLGTGVHSKISVGLPSKHYKVLAALCFQHGGIESACDFLRKIGVVRMEYPKYEPLPKTQQKRIQRYETLQSVLEYKFRDVGILARAFMHATAFRDPGSNNEVLEFLGDAVLELCLTQYTYERYPSIPLGDAVVLKMDLVGNNLLGWLSMSPPLELQNFLMHKTSEIVEDIVPWDRTKESGFENASAGKIASDTFEALIGAVFLDSGYDIDAARRVILLMMKDVVENLSDYGIQEPDP